MKLNQRRTLARLSGALPDLILSDRTLACKKLFLLLVLSGLLSCGLGLVWVHPLVAATTKLESDQLAQASGGSNPRADRLSAEIRDAVLKDAAQRSGVSLPSLIVTQSTAKTFSNPCEFNFGEVCTREYTPIPGWEVLVRVKSQIWKYHVNQSGSQRVLDPHTTSANPGQLPASVRQALLEDAAEWASLPESAIKILEAQQKIWDNRCAFSFGVICPANYAPISGWQVTVQARQLRWVYRVSQDAKQVVMDRRVAMPTPVADAIVRDLVKRSPRVATPDTLRFLEAKEKSQNVCSASGECQTLSYWLAIVSNGRQQWGYRADDQGKRLLQIPIAQVVSADR
ncbi:MAG: hypothetical protein KME16_11070 [Scytolyngbya sp. HA4215-MV1]|jgi:hypothetical protein|nr:hypothetical protein [Scytolyngbya sp. HA4215-MV1]